MNEKVITRNYKALRGTKMDLSEKILVKKDSLEKMKVKLRGLKLSVDDKSAQSVIGDILEILDNELKFGHISVENMIKDKMTETKSSNPDLHFKLYMLYRKLVDNKITEEEALKGYKIYLHS